MDKKKIANGVIQVGVFKLLFEHRSEGDATSICPQNEGLLAI